MTNAITTARKYEPAIAIAVALYVWFGIEWLKSNASTEAFVGSTLAVCAVSIVVLVDVLRQLRQRRFAR